MYYKQLSGRSEMFVTQRQLRKNNKEMSLVCWVHLSVKHMEKYAQIYQIKGSLKQNIFQ